MVIFFTFYSFQLLTVYLETYFTCLNSEQGLWFGILCGLVVQMLLLLTITLCTNWDKEVSTLVYCCRHLIIMTCLNLVFMSMILIYERVILS